MAAGGLCKCRGNSIKSGVWARARAVACGVAAEHKDHVWAWDFMFDRTANGRPIKWLSIVDEYTRECVALEVDRRHDLRGRARRAASTCLRIRGVPKHIRSDNGPEFIAQAIRQFLAQAGVETLYIEPGSPVAERLCRELPQPAAERAARRRGVRERGERPRLWPRPGEASTTTIGRTAAWATRPPRQFAAGVRRFRSGCACAPAAHPHRRRPQKTITRYPTHTLITPGTKNGGIPLPGATTRITSVSTVIRCS